MKLIVVLVLGRRGKATLKDGKVVNITEAEYHALPPGIYRSAYLTPFFDTVDGELHDGEISFSGDDILLGTVKGIAFDIKSNYVIKDGIGGPTITPDFMGTLDITDGEVKIAGS